MRIDGRVLEGLRATTRFGDVRTFEEVDSTNRCARDAAAEGVAEGLVVVADHQRAGRGRAGRSWDAPPGTGLLASVLLRPRDLPPERLHLVTSAVALAAAGALSRTAGFDADLKWPNDLLVGDRKLAGVLAEALDVGTGRPVGAVVVGVGINISAAPDGAVCAEEVAGRPVGAADVLVAMLEELEVRLGRWDAVADEYRARCATVGRRVLVELPGGATRHGVAVAVDGDGRLVVADEPDEPGEVAGVAGVATAYSVADVVHVRSRST